MTFTRNNPAAVRLDRTSLRQYLRQIGASGPIFELFEVAYATEFGLDSDVQSCLSLVFLIGTDVSEGFEVFGVSNQKYKVRGGNDQQRAINQLGYGANTKLFVSFQGRPWRVLGLTGGTFTDGTYQLSWDNSRPQPVETGGLTLDSGGAPGPGRRPWHS